MSRKTTVLAPQRASEERLKVAQWESVLALPSQNVTTEPDALLLGDVLNWYEKTQVIKKKGRRNEESTLRVIRSVAGPDLLALPAYSIRRDDIAVYCDRRRSGSWAARTNRLLTPSESTIAKELSIISSAFKSARRDLGLHIINPVSPDLRPQRENAPRKPLSPDEFAAIVSAAESYERRPSASVLILLAIYLSRDAGLRLMDIESLRWAQFDAERGTVTVFGRRIVLSPPAVAIVRRHQLGGDSARPFPNQSESIRTAWNRVRKIAGHRTLAFDAVRLMQQ